MNYNNNELQKYIINNQINMVMETIRDEEELIKDLKEYRQKLKKANEKITKRFFRKFKNKEEIKYEEMTQKQNKQLMDTAQSDYDNAVAQDNLEQIMKNRRKHLELLNNLKKRKENLENKK